MASVALAATGLMASVAVGGSAQAQASSPGGPPNQDEIQQVDSSITNVRLLPNGQLGATLRIGPIELEPYDGDGGHGPHGDMVAPLHGPDEPLHGTHTIAMTEVDNWMCNGCYITALRPDLVYADGSRADLNTGAMLHHSLFGEKDATDLTCGGTELNDFVGKRMFASGNERTAAQLPRGYGARMGSTVVAQMELMNMTDQPQTVYHTLDVSVTHPLFSWGIKEVTPVWMDQAPCTWDSAFPVPEGESHHSWEWESTISGTAVAVGGHLHDGGDTISVSNATTGTTLCDMRAEYGTKPTSEGRLDAITPVCTGNLGAVNRGDTLRQDSSFHMNYADPHQMAISLVYIAEN
jgi:hypothetical protein